MKLKRRSNQEQARGSSDQGNPRKVAALRELAALKVPFDPHPIIETLKRKLNVLACLDLDDRQTPGVVDGQKIDNSARSCGELRGLAVNWGSAQAGIQDVRRAPDLRFQPGFGVTQVQRIRAIRSGWASQTRKTSR